MVLSTTLSLAKDTLIRNLKDQGINSSRVLGAIIDIDRSAFVARGYESVAWDNRPLPLSHGVTISQPYVVARMSELLLPEEEMCQGEKPLKKVLEIGTGSGYQAAILSMLADEVYSVERIGALLNHAKPALEKSGITNVTVKLGDGHEGWEEHGPFDAIIVTAAAPAIPPALYKQLRIGGKLIAPIGNAHYQELKLVRRKSETEFATDTLDGVIFVPLLKGTERA